METAAISLQKPETCEEYRGGEKAAMLFKQTCGRRELDFIFNAIQY